MTADRVYDTFYADVSGRADALIKKQFAHLSRSEIKTILAAGKVSTRDSSGRKCTVNKGTLIPGGAEITLETDQHFSAHTPGKNNSPRFTVIFEDAHILAVNKPAGMHTVCNKISDTGTLVNEVYAYTGCCPENDNVRNCGSVNRLDFETSGIVLFAKTAESFQKLKDIYHSDNVIKKYAAVTGTHYPPGTTLTAMFERSKEIISADIIAETIKPAAFSENELKETFHLHSVTLSHGFRHQIRKTFADNADPVLGDVRFGGQNAPRLYLHAWQLTLPHPISGHMMELEAPLPWEMLN